MNLKTAVSLITLLLTLSLTACQPSPPAKQQILNSIASHVIAPFHQQFADSTQQLQQTSQTFCQQTNEIHWQTLRVQWQSSMQHWQAVKLIQFGPITKNNQAWKIQFWPDKHNLIRKKINALLNSSDTLNVERVQQASVVTQGLSALEFLLFDNKGGQLSLYNKDDEPRRCQLLLAVANHTHQVATHLNNAWQAKGNNYLKTLTQTGETNTDFPTRDDAIAALVDTLVASLELAKRDQLAGPLGYRIKGGQLVKGKTQVYASEAWRSRNSLTLLQAHLQAAQTLYYGGPENQTKRFGFYHYLRQQAATKILADAIGDQFTTTNKQFTSIDQTLFEALSQPQSLTQLDTLFQQVTQLEKIVKNNLPTSLGVTLGFNSNDGD
ncbi:MAG: imelysin family protein [Spongiibacteraceae bacterium]|nr:imelysin family protein [Spongiibacteraceae bacterium]